jgi:hypothetical protein
MRWIAYIIVGWIVVAFVVGAIIGHLITRRPHDSQRAEASPSTGEEAGAGDERTRRSA